MNVIHIPEQRADESTKCPIGWCKRHVDQPLGTEHIGEEIEVTTDRFQSEVRIYASALEEGAAPEHLEQLVTVAIEGDEGAARTYLTTTEVRAFITNLIAVLIDVEKQESVA